MVKEVFHFPYIRFSDIVFTVKYWTLQTCRRIPWLGNWAIVRDKRTQNNK